MSFEGLQERLAALQETTTQLKELIDRLADLKFQPGSVPLGTDEESSVSGELSAEIGQILREGEDEQELLQEEVGYLRVDGHEKARIRDGIERLGRDLASRRVSFRKARLSAKKSLAQAQRLERELLVRSYSRPASEAGTPSINDENTSLHHTPRRIQQHQQSSLSEEDQQTVGASSNVTSALRRTHDLIAAELSRSDYAHQTLTESSDALKQLNESYSSLDTMLASSKDLLGTLLRSQKSDTWYLQTAMYMLMVTGAWLIFRRLLYGPMWWLVWLPLRLLFGASVKVGSAVIGKQHPGESGKIEVGGADGKVSVDGLPNGDLPTAQVGQKTAAKDGDPDSMVEKVGRIVDSANEADEVPKNTKKRMWEDAKGAEDGSREKDEL